MIHGIYVDPADDQRNQGTARASVKPTGEPDVYIPCQTS